MSVHFTLPMDDQVSDNAQRIMIEGIRAREDDVKRTNSKYDLGIRTRGCGDPRRWQLLLYAARFALLQRHGRDYDLVPIQEAIRAEVCFH